MQVTLPVTLGVTTTIEPSELLKMLAQSLDMEYAFEDNYFCRKDPETQTLKVWQATDEGDMVVDDRTDLFLALRQLADCMAEETDES